MRHISKLINIWLLKVFLGRVQKNVFKFGNIVIVTPHPDDEIFGLGGIIIQHNQENQRIHIVYLSDGESSDVWLDKEEIRFNRIQISNKVINLLGIEPEDVTRLHIPDSSIPDLGQPGFEKAVVTMKELIDSIKPDMVFVTHTLDYWPFDHVAAAHIAEQAVIQSETKPELWYYWVWAWYNIRPWQLFRLKYRNLQKVDISYQLKGKIELTDIYLKSLTPDGKPWCGILPNQLLKVLRYPYEIIERIL